MKHNVEECAVILRELNQRRGVGETTVEVSSLAELFDYCLSLKEPRLLERFVLAGRDDAGRARAVTFVFQSITDRQRG